MIKVECDNCGKDRTDDYIYCQSCYEALEEKLNNTQSDLDSANAEIESQEREISRLEEIITGLESKLNNSITEG